MQTSKTRSSNRLPGQSAPSVNREKQRGRAKSLKILMHPSPPFRPGATNLPDSEHTTNASIDAYASNMPAHNEIMVGGWYMSDLALVIETTIHTRVVSFEFSSWPRASSSIASPLLFYFFFFKRELLERLETFFVRLKTRPL